MPLNEMESNEEPKTGGKPIEIELPSSHEFPGHRIPQCDIALL